MSPDFVDVSCDNVGTHSMQRLVEIVCEESEKMVIFNSIAEHIEDMARHPKGNYVLLAILGILKKQELQFVIEKLLPILYELSAD